MLKDSNQYKTKCKVDFDKWVDEEDDTKLADKMDFSAYPLPLLHTDARSLSLSHTHAHRKRKKKKQIKKVRERKGKGERQREEKGL